MSNERIPSQREFRKQERSPEELERLKELRERFQRDRPSPDSGHDVKLVMSQGDYFDLIATLAQFKVFRNGAGLSLSEMAAKTGLDAATISEVESGQFANLTISALQTLAHGLGKRLVVRFEESDAA